MSDVLGGDADLVFSQSSPSTLDDCEHVREMSSNQRSSVDTAVLLGHQRGKLTQTAAAVDLVERAGTASVHEQA